MAVTEVDYNYADAELGIYGLYNNFFGIAKRVGVETIYNLTYRVKITTVYDSEEVVKNIDPIEGFAVFNPFELIKSTFFKAEYNGSTEHTQPYAYNQVRIEVGASFSTAADTPPTFEGYITNDTFQVYNGYETPPIVTNYRDPNWYNTTPIKLPKVKKELRLLEDDVELLSFPSEIDNDIGTLEAANLVQVFYDSSDSVVLTSTTDLTIRPDLTGIGYWNININAAFVGETSYIKAYIQYFDGEAFYNSEQITIRRAECNPKQDRFRMYWVNRYGGAEYENFTLKSDEEIRITKGKRIQSDGVNYKAQTFTDIENINNPNLSEYGNTAARYRTIRTDYIEQNQVDALQELYKSPIAIMFDVNNIAQAVLIEDTNYKKGTVKDGLVSVDVRVKIANTEPIQKQ